MKTILLSFLTALTLSLAPRALAEDPRVAKLEAADDRRVVAFRTPSQSELAAILSDELRYAHASGAVDTKASLTETLLSGRLQYLGLDYEERHFTFPAPKIALMSGRLHLQAKTAAGAIDTPMSFLGVWREEEGGWHFLAWQSAKIAPPAAAK